MLTGRRCGGTPAERLAVEPDLALGRLLEAGEHAHQRGLAAAGRAEQREELALVDVERLVVDGDESAEALGDVAELDEGLRRGIVPRLEVRRTAPSAFFATAPPSRRGAGTAPGSRAPLYWPVFDVRPDARDERAAGVGSYGCLV